MKTFIQLLFTLMIAFSPILTLAQQGDKTDWEQRKQQFKTDKIAFISSQVNFSVEDAQIFWPIYNKYDAIFDRIGDDRHKNFDNKRQKNLDEISDSDCANMIKQGFELDQQELDARKAFHEELSKVLSQNKIMKYYQAEYDFRRRIISDQKPHGASFGKSFKNN